MTGEKTTLSGMAGPGRLDKALADASGLSRARVQALLGEGRVRLGGQAVSQASLKLLGETPYAINLPAAVPAEEFDGAVDSFAVSGMVSQFDRNTESYNVRGVPAFLVNALRAVVGRRRHGQL